MYQPPPNRGLCIVHLDEQLLVLDKPPGLLAVPGRSADKHDSLSVRAQAVFPRALVVHRLDQPTSGLMLFALTPEAQSHFGRLFQRREVFKEYIAVVRGRPEPGAGEVDLPLIADWPNRPRQRIDHDIGKPSRTRYELIEHDPASDSSRMRLLPLTGRSHQLRLHMAAIGHPMLGDELYADEATHARSDRLMLHAHRLCFVHPQTGREISLESPLPF